MAGRWSSNGSTQSGRRRWRGRVRGRSGRQKRLYRVLRGRVALFSPDGTHIAVFLGEKGVNGDYWIVPIAAGEPRRVTFDVTEGGPPVWTPDGKHLVVSSTRAGSLTLWRVSVSGGAPKALTTGAGEDLDPSSHSTAGDCYSPT